MLMSFTDVKRREIKNYLLRKIDEDDPGLVAKVADAFGISQTSVKRYIESEISDLHIRKDSVSACGYSLIFKSEQMTYDITKLRDDEDGTIYKDVLPHLNVCDNSLRIWRYTLPEIFNNAIEHSKGKEIKVYVDSCSLYTRISITDDGIGIFKNIIAAMKEYGFRNPGIDDAVTELYKGKFTSCPERHTGEGIFFSMHMLDKMSIVSDGTLIRRGFSMEAAIVRSHILAYAIKLSKKGTVVIMELDNSTRRDAGEVFSTYADVDEGFIKTRIPVFEACLDRDPVARSQARRICARLENFKEAVLDFENAEIMGQGFADELFRVFHNEHPDVVLTPINMNEEIHRMYLYTKNNKVVVPRYN